MHLPPRFLRRIIASCLPADDERAVLDELDALYDDRRGRRGAWRANRWYARQTAGFVWRVGAARLAAFLGGSDGLREELRYSVRSLSRRPAFTAAFVLTLAVGAGVVTTVYAAARWVLLRPVPHVRAPEELFTMRLTQPEAPPVVAFEIMNPDVEVLRQRLPSRENLAAILSIEVDLSHKGSESQRVDGEMISANYFNVLGTPLVAGRAFLPSEDLEAAIPPAIVSAELAESLTGSATAAVGTDIRINGTAVRIVGVAPRGFRGNELPGKAQIWMPLSTLLIIDPSADPPHAQRPAPRMWRKLIGRAPPGWTTEALAREANLVVASVRKEFRYHSYPANDQFFRVYDGIGLDPTVRVTVRRTLTFLGGATVLLLLLAAANLANLTLVRATMTNTATAIRLALGASRLRIARIVFVDALVLGAAGTIGALALASIWSRWYRSTQLAERGGALAGMHVDGWTLALTLSIALIVSMVAFVRPALMARFITLDMQLRRANTGAPSQRLRTTLVAIQVALSVMLLVGAGLLGRTVANLRHIDIGFNPDRILTLAMDPHLHGIEAARLGQFARDFERQASSVASVEGVGLISPSPLRSGYLTNSLYPPGTDPSGRDRSGMLQGAGYYVSSGFFKAIEARVIAGNPEWSADSGEVVLTRAGVAKLFPGEDPRRVIGRLLPRFRKPPVRLIAVVEDVRLSSIKSSPPPVIFTALADRFEGLSVTAFVASPTRPTRLAGPMRNVIASLAPELPAYDVRTARDAVDRQFAERIALARAATTLGTIGLLLAAFGLYGVLANVVAARKREIGIRAAMGAAPRRILLRVIGDGLVPVSGGLVVGAIGAIGMTKALQSQLFSVERSDAATWTLALVTLAAAATIACLIPAWRASRVSPAEVLRDD